MQARRWEAVLLHVLRGKRAVLARVECGEDMEDDKFVAHLHSLENRVLGSFCSRHGVNRHAPQRELHSEEDVELRRLQDADDLLAVELQQPRVDAVHRHGARIEDANAEQQVVGGRRLLDLLDEGALAFHAATDFVDQLIKGFQTLSPSGTFAHRINNTCFDKTQ